MFSLLKGFLWGVNNFIDMILWSVTIKLYK